MQCRKFSRNYKLEAVKLVKERRPQLHRRPVTLMPTRMCCAKGSRTFQVAPWMSKDPFSRGSFDRVPRRGVALAVALRSGQSREGISLRLAG